MANNKIYIAAAGSGKTTFIIKNAVDLQKSGLLKNKKILIVTFTKNNQSNIRDRIINIYKYIPSNIVICGWYTFLLDYWIRPFKGTVLEQLYERHVGLLYVEGNSGKKKLQNGKYITTHKNEIEKFLDKEGRNIYSDKLAEFALKCCEKSKGSLLPRLSNIINSIYIDEVQDLVAYDYEIIKKLLELGTINCILCGDPRQYIYDTSKAGKNRKYKGDIVSYIKDKVNTNERDHVDIDETTLSKSHRCNTEICNFASKIRPKCPPMEMCTCDECAAIRKSYTLQQGVFLVKKSNVQDYVDAYNPLSLTWDKSTKTPTKKRMNWGESKGSQADATLIHLTKILIAAFNPCKKKTKQISMITKNKLYVAVTRARYAVGLVVPNDFDNTSINLPFWNKND